MNFQSFNTVTVNLDHLRANYRLLQKEAGEARFLAMVKADGYGHGMVECAQALEDEGCSIFGVAELGEAVQLRQSGIDAAIFAMIGFDHADAEAFCEYGITPVVYDGASLEALSKAAAKRSTTLDVHIKVDTGMRRLGVDDQGLEKLLGVIDSSPGLVLGGIASHFPSADDRDSDSTPQCIDTFRRMLAKTKGRKNIIRHIANSGGTLYFPDARCDMVRCGISLYGYYPEGREQLEADGLLPVMSYSSRVLQVKEVPAGCGISYGHTYVTDRPTTIAVLPVGYEDGFSRSLSNRGEVLIRGQRARVLGRVCMNLCMVDVTAIEGVVAGDEAVLLGRQEDERITADEIAAAIGTISYEILCMIGNNNQRRFI